MTKKPLDQREDPRDDSEADAASFRVDRVFTAPTPRPVTNNASGAVRRARTASSAPLGHGGESQDTEIALRRQLSRLQRQLSDAQRELANKDEELAAEVEKRIDAVAGHDQLVEANTELQTRIDVLSAYQQRTTGIEQRMLDAVNATEEISRARDRERQLRADALTRVDEVTAVLDEAQAQWRSERSKLEAQTAVDAGRVEGERKAAIDAANAAHEAAIARSKESHEAELAQLKASNASALSVLRGELEPKALEALSLAEKHQKLSDEIEAQRSTHATALAEKDEAHARTLAAEAEKAAAERSTAATAHQTELARVQSERDAHALVIEQAKRSAEGREKHWEETVEGVRGQHQQATHEAGEARENVARLEAERAISEGRIAMLAETIEKLSDEKKLLRSQLDVADGEVRRNSLDRRRFVAYLEEGLAMLGALPPRAEDDAEIEITADEPVEEIT